MGTSSVSKKSSIRKLKPRQAVTDCLLFLWSYLPKFSFFFGNAPAKKKTGKKKPEPTETIDYEIHQMVGINILEILQSYLWENKTVKGGLLWELPLSVYSDWKINLTYTH